MHDDRRRGSETSESRKQNPPGGRKKPGRTTLALLSIMLVLGSLLMGCELLDNLGAGTGTGAGTGAAGGAVLPSTTALIEEARRVGRSPYEVLERRYLLKKDAINTKYNKEIRAIDTKVSAGAMTATEAEPTKKLLELKQAKELATLEAVRDQRNAEINELSEILNSG